MQQQDNQGTPGTASGPSRRTVRRFAISAAVLAFGMIALVGWALWTAGRPDPVRPEPRFERFRPEWESAMAKAGVEASFPAGPLALDNVRASGRHAFEATFTAGEITALLNVYRYSAEVQGSQVEVPSARVELRDGSRVGLSGRLLADGSAYSAEAVGEVAYSGGRIVSERLTSLTVEGFSVGGRRRQRALQALLGYFNQYLDAAPGLTIDSVTILEGEASVSGFAPDRLTHPKVTE